MPCEKIVKIMTGFTALTVVPPGDMTPVSGTWKSGKEPDNLAKRIYVGGLPYSATENDVENLFNGSGTVTSVSIVTDRYTGQAKGFGFVEMSSDEEADAAISALNGTMMGGRTLTVNEARPREERGGGGGRGGYGGGGGGGRGGHSGGGGGGRDRDRGFGNGGGRW